MLLEQLVASGAAEVRGDVVALLADAFVPRRGGAEQLRILTEDPAELIETMLRNTLAEDGERLLQRKVYFDNIGADAASRVRDEMRREGERFLRRIERLLARHDRDRNPRAAGGARHYAGVGVYFFETPRAPAPAAPPARPRSRRARTSRRARRRGAGMRNGLAMLAISLLVALAGCASDGGQRGTGIAAAEGNVVDVRAGGRAADPMPEHAVPGSMAGAVAADQADLADIEVSIEGTDLRTTTDEAGRFSLRGRFAGDTNLVFARAADRLAARLAVNAPAGGSLTLRDVVLEVASGVARASTTEVVFQGEVVASACEQGLITLASAERAADDLDTYVLALGTSSLHDADGRPLACTELREGDRLDVRGTFAPDGTIGNAEVTVR